MNRLVKRIVQSILAGIVTYWIVKAFLMIGLIVYEVNRNSMNWNTYGRWRHPEYFKTNPTNRLLIVCCILLTFLSVWLGVENKNLHQQLKEEVRIKYEYSYIIDSLMSESEAYQREGMRHWQEELEKDYIQTK